MLERELSRYWKTVVDTIQDAIMIVDNGGTIVSVNKAFEKITGFKKEEIIGRPCTILNCDRCDIVRIKDKNHWCKLFVRGQLKMSPCAVIRKDGASVHVVKNASCLRDDEGEIIGAVETMTDISELIEKDTQIEAFRKELRSEDGFHGILGTSVQMQRVFDLIENAARSDAPVIIFGESGTGKELVARAIHEISARKAAPYVKVNCAALNEALLESELFGHVKGAFTGAHRSRVGRFEAATGGDVFLDEIGDLPLSIQVKLLRVLEEKVIERVGMNRPIPVNVRVISATNKDLRHLVASSAFREDLYYRINVIPITIPPLRERRGDIPLLAHSFFSRLVLKSDKKLQGISREAMDLLMDYSWPGNVRELKSAFEYAFVTCQNGMIEPHCLPFNINQDPVAGRPSKNNHISRDETKKRQLIEALEQAGGNKTMAARILGITRVTVWNRMKRYGITARRTYLKGTWGQT